MITFDKNSGHALKGWDACAARIVNLLTTQLGERFKRNYYGVKDVAGVGMNLTQANAMVLQNDILRALKSPANGVASEFKATQVSIRLEASGAKIHVVGEFKGQLVRVGI